MTLDIHPDDPTGHETAPAPGPVRTRVVFTFDGELDDVPTAAAAALTGVARALLQHGDDHDGSSATMRTARLGSLLHLWLTDPECSPACLGGSAHLPSTADQAGDTPGDVRLVLDCGPEGGLRLHWSLGLAQGPGAAPSVSSVAAQRWGTDERNLTGTHRRTRRGTGKGSRQ